MEALQLTASELLPLLQRKRPPHDHNVDDAVPKKRLREDNIDSDAKEPADTAPRSSLALSTAPCEFAILRRLVGDVIGVLPDYCVRAEGPPSDSTETEVVSLACDFFFGEDFLDSVSDAVNYHVIATSASVYRSGSPLKHSVLQLCATHLNALKRDAGSCAPAAGALSVGVDSMRLQYELNAIRWPEGY